MPTLRNGPGYGIHRRANGRAAMDDFESFTRTKITRLRAEADALEKILKEFQATQNRRAGAARRSGGDQPRSGAFGVIMEAIAGAGAGGMTLDDMIGAAELEGYEVKRATLRAQVWKAKEDGELTAMEPGRYRSAVHDDFAGVFTGTPESDEAAAGGGFQPVGGRLSKEEREKFSADLDDEIPF